MDIKKNRLEEEMKKIMEEMKKIDIQINKILKEDGRKRIIK